MSLKRTFGIYFKVAVIMITFFCTSATFANFPIGIANLDKEKLSFEQELPSSIKQYFDKKIAFPVSASNEKIDATFEVIFMVNAVGQLQVLSIEGNNPKIAQYLFKKIEGFKPCASEISKFQVYQTKFTFKGNA
ncbi:MAG: hypothetical protein ACXITV_05790 [Luteibaculaceae bacterium]